MGRITASRKQLKPDPVYGSILASKFINCLMYDGKKSTAQQVFYDAMDRKRDKIGFLYTEDATLVWNGNAIEGGENVAKYEVIFSVVLNLAIFIELVFFVYF